MTKYRTPIRPIEVGGPKSPEELKRIEAEKLAKLRMEESKRLEQLQLEAQQAQEKAEFEQWKKAKAEQERVLLHSAQQDRKNILQNIQEATTSDDLSNNATQSNSNPTATADSNRQQQKDAISSNQRKRFSIGFSADEVDQIEAAANEMAIPTSTMLRSWILQKLKTLSR